MMGRAPTLPRLTRGLASRSRRHHAVPHAVRCLDYAAHPDIVIARTGALACPCAAFDLRSRLSRRARRGDARAAIERIVAVRGERSAANTLRPFDDAINATEQAQGLTAIATQLHPD